MKSSYIIYFFLIIAIIIEAIFFWVIGSPINLSSVQGTVGVAKIVIFSTTMAFAGVILLFIDSSSDNKILKLVNSNLIIIGAIITFALFSIIYFPITSDDAYISFEYSKNFGLGKGLYFSSVGISPSEGYSNFLWVIIGSFFVFIHLDPVFFMKLIGFLSGLLILRELRILSSIIGMKNHWSQLPSLFLALNPYFSFWAVSGLETAFFSILILTSARLLIIEVKENDESKKLVIPMVLIGLGLARFEGIFVVILFYFIFFYLKSKNEKLSEIIKTKSFFYNHFPPLIILFTYNLWRFLYFGDILPSTYYAKVVKAQSIPFPYYDFIFIEIYILWVLFAFLGIIFSTNLKNDYSSNNIGINFLFLAIIGIFGLYINSFDWMNGARLLLPYLPFFILLSTKFFFFIFNQTDLISTIIKSLNSQSISEYFSLDNLRILMGIGFFIMILLFQSFSPFLDNSIDDVGEQGWSEGMVERARYLTNTYPKAITLVAYDIGALAYYTDFEIIDIGGLNDFFIATHISQPSLVSDYVMNLTPDLFFLPDQSSYFEPLFLAMINSGNYTQDSNRPNIYFKSSLLS